MRDIWTDISLTFRKCWQRPGTQGVMATVSGATNSLLDRESSWCAIRVGITRGQMNCEIYRLVTHQVIPNLPPNSVAALESRPITTKCITNFLRNMRTFFCRSMYVWVTFKLEKLPRIISLKLRENINISQVSSAPYTCNLNPTELASVKLTNMGTYEMLRTHEETQEFVLECTSQIFGVE
jgi:hypothetical protein